MASIKDLILSIESADSSFDEKLAAINKMEETLVAMRQQEEQAVQDNVDLIVEAIKLMEKKVTDQLEIAKSIVPEKGDKGDKGDRGADGKAGRDGLDGRDGKDGRDGVDGADGVSVTDAKIDFDGSLVITLSTGREINVGEVVAPDLAEKIKVITTMSTNGAVVIKDEGTTISGGVKSINFVGASVTATNSGDDVTVSVAGSVYNPSNVAITGGSINGTTIGATTPAAGTFTTLTANSTAQFGRSSANYFEFAGAATTKTVEAKALGSDTNIAFTIDSKGTGAVNLAAGSSGVNISNGGTVTALTRTAQGSGYTTLPSVAISAPTTAGGVQATASAIITILSYTISAGGSGYTVGDTVTLTGGTFTQAWSGTVATVSAGAITSITTVASGSYTVFPTGPAALSGGTGSGATLSTFSGGITSVITITNAGSGYVEQPTVTFSGGGGSGAAAYATVGGTTTVKSIGQTMNFYTANGGIGLSISDLQSTSTPAYLLLQANSATSINYAQGGSTANTNIAWVARGTGSHQFYTNTSTGTEQFRVTHTASAVNYVQVTGAATGSSPSITATGSDGSVGLTLLSRGTSSTGSLISFASNLTSTNYTFRIAAGSTANANYLQVAPSATTASPVLSSQGSDTNIDLTLTPKGTGRVQFGTYTATVSIITGYIEIKDSGGTVRRLAVVS